MLRLDHLQRPELNKGTVDFDVASSEEYWAQNPPPHIASPYYSVEPPPTGPRPPVPLDYIFAFDVSNEALSSGFLQSACGALQSILYGNTNFPPTSQIAIMTFDRVLHFYDLAVGYILSLLHSAYIILVRYDPNACCRRFGRSLRSNENNICRPN